MNNHENFGNRLNLREDDDSRFEEFDRDKAEQNREREKARNNLNDAARALSGGLKLQLLQNGANVDEDDMQFFFDMRKGGLISDKEVSDYVKSAKTPAEQLRDGYHGLEPGDDPWKKACDARYNLDFSKMSDQTRMHAQRILEMFSGGDFAHPERANGDSYRKFMERFPTAMDFDETAWDFVKTIGVAGEDRNSIKSQTKREEYAHDMKEFQKAMYGDQQERLNAVEALEMNVETSGHLTQNVEIASDLKNNQMRNIDPVERSRQAVLDSYSGGVLESDGAEEPTMKNEEVKMAEPNFGDDLGNGYKCASFGFVDKSDAFNSKTDNEDVVFYKPTRKWYIAVK